MILVTGATGFLGSILVRQITDTNQQIIAIKRPSSKIPRFLEGNPLITWVDVDICDYFQVYDNLKNVKQVYHCAAKVSYDPNDSEEMHKVNIEGTENIVNVCLKYDIRLLHVSSIASLGKSKQALINESDVWEYDSRLSNYSVSKYYGEMEVWRGIEEGLNAVIVNPSIILGKDSGIEGSGQIFGLVNKGLGIYPTGSVGLVAVEDVTELMITLMNDDTIRSERYIINGENVTNKELVEKISVLMGKKKPKISANRWMLGVLWRLSMWSSKIFRHKPFITKDSARAAINKMAFSNKKITQLTAHKFKPIDQVLEEIVKHLKSTQTI